MAKVLSVKEISKAWNVDQCTVNRLITSGKIAATKFGKQWRVREDDLNKYVKAHTTKVA